MHGEYKVPGGKLVVADCEVVDGRFASVQISGDFFLEPDTALSLINRAIEGQAAELEEAVLASRIDAVLGPDVQMFGVSALAIAVAVRRAVQQHGTSEHSA